MGDISLPRSEEFYRVQYTIPAGVTKPWTETVYRTRLDFEQVTRNIEARTKLGWVVEKVEHCIVEVTVVDVTGVFSQDVVSGRETI